MIGEEKGQKVGSSRSACMTSEKFGFTGQSTIEMTHDRFHAPHKQQEKKEDPDKGYALTLQQECICSLRVARVALRRFKGIDDAAFRPQEGVASFHPRSGKTIPAAEQRFPRFAG